MAHVKRQHFGEFASVYATRWWDYRRLAPGHSFALFNREYLKAMRFGARNFVASRGPQRDAKGKVMTGAQIASHNRLYGAIFTKQTEADVWERDTTYIVGLFKAMMAADLFGIPYDHFCRIAIATALDKGWDRVPVPSQLYSDRLAAETIDAWEATLSDKLPTARHPVYDVDNYCGLPVQDDYRAWLIEGIKKRQTEHAIPLAVVLYHQPQLPLELAAKHFSEQTLRRARSLA